VGTDLPTALPLAWLAEADRLDAIPVGTYLHENLDPGTPKGSTIIAYIVSVLLNVVPIRAWLGVYPHQGRPGLYVSLHVKGSPRTQWRSEHIPALAHLTNTSDDRSRAKVAAVAHLLGICSLPSEEA